MSEEVIDFSQSDAVDHIEADLLVSQSSILDKIAEQEKLSSAVEEFLQSGGSINYIDPSVMADPPKKPENKYGSHPI